MPRRTIQTTSCELLIRHSHIAKLYEQATVYLCMFMLTEISDAFYFPATRLCYINHELCVWHFYFTNMLNKRQKFGINFVWQKQCFPKWLSQQIFLCAQSKSSPYFSSSLNLKYPTYFSSTGLRWYSLWFSISTSWQSATVLVIICHRGFFCGMSAHVRDPQGGLLLLSQLLFSILSFSFWPSITLSLKCSFDKCKFVIIILPRFQFFPLWNFISTLSLVFVPLVLLLIFDWPIHLQWNVWNEMGVQLLFFLSLTDAPLSIISQLLQTIYANSCILMSH